MGRQMTVFDVLERDLSDIERLQVVTRQNVSIIRDTVHRLNWLYGVGDVRDLHCEFDTKGRVIAGHAVVEPYRCRTKKVKFSIDLHDDGVTTVKYRRHQRTLYQRTFNEAE